MSTEPNPQPQPEPSVHTVHMPAPTAWPITFAAGVTFLFLGITTYWLVSVMGAALMIFGAIGWFRDVLPHEHHDEYRVTIEPIEVSTTRVQVSHLAHKAVGQRAIVPVERYTPMAGVQGGIAGAVAMVIPAIIYGYVYQHSVWYAPNLLAAMALPNWADQSTEFLRAFHLGGFLVAIGIHVFTSVLVGILYGSVLPMSPKWPILKAGFLAPLFWTGLITIGLSAVNPLLLDRINWLWFILSQIAFGLVAGYVVNLHVKVRTPQFLERPFYERAGIISREMEQDWYETKEQEEHDKDNPE